QCLAVVGEGTRRASVDVARELVEQNDQAQAAARAVGPARELTAPRPLDHPCEARADQLVTLAAQLRRAGGEPQLLAPLQLLCRHRQRAEPELPHLTRLIHSDRLGEPGAPGNRAS